MHTVAWEYTVIVMCHIMHTCEGLALEASYSSARESMKFFFLFFFGHDTSMYSQSMKSTVHT